MFTFDGIPMPYAKDQSKAKAKANASGTNRTKPQPDWPGLISPMSVLDNVENFVIDVALVVLLLSLKQSQVPALAGYLLPANARIEQE